MMPNEGSSGADGQYSGNVFEPPASPEGGSAHVQQQQQQYSSTAPGGGLSHQTPNPGSALGEGAYKIFVGGLSPVVTTEALIAHFSAYGEVTDATVMTDKITGRPRGFGFVSFKKPEAVDQLLAEAHMLDGKQVECKRAVPMGLADSRMMRPSGGGGGGPGGMPGSSGPPNAAYNQPKYNPEKIFVGGLPISCDDNKLREHFSKYGPVVDCVVMVDRDMQRHRGFGYVLFENASSVDTAVGDHDKHEIDGKWIDVKRCVVQDGRPDPMSSGGGGGGGSAGWPQSGPVRKGGYNGGGKGGFYGRGGPSGYGGSEYGAQPSYGSAPGMDSGYGKGGKGSYGRGAGKATGAGGYGMGGYGMGYGGATPAYGYGAPADSYGGAGAYGAYGATGYGAVPAYAGYGAVGGYGTGAPAYGAYGQSATSQGPTAPGNGASGDLYAASRRVGYRSTPY